VAFSEVIPADCVAIVVAVAAGAGEAEGFVKMDVIADGAIAAFRAGQGICFTAESTVSAFLLTGFGKRGNRRTISQMKDVSRNNQWTYLDQGTLHLIDFTKTLVFHPSLNKISFVKGCVTSFWCFLEQ
jgi:hypothetical protein